MFGGRVRAADRIVHQRRVAREIGLLLQQHDVGAGDNRPLALVGLDASGEQLEQRRLARTIAADQCKPIARADVDVEILKQPAGALHQGQAFVRENGSCHDERLAT